MDLPMGYKHDVQMLCRTHSCAFRAADHLLQQLRAARREGSFNEQRLETAAAEVDVLARRLARERNERTRIEREIEAERQERQSAVVALGETESELQRLKLDFIANRGDHPSEAEHRLAEHSLFDVFSI